MNPFDEQRQRLRRQLAREADKEAAYVKREEDALWEKEVPSKPAEPSLYRAGGFTDPDMTHVLNKFRRKTAEAWAEYYDAVDPQPWIKFPDYLKPEDIGKVIWIQSTRMVNHFSAKKLHSLYAVEDRIDQWNHKFAKLPWNCYHTTEIILSEQACVQLGITQADLVPGMPAKGH